MSGVQLQTVKKWKKDLDILGEWLCYNETAGCVTRVYCEVCAKHADNLKCLRNYSPSFVNGVTGSSLKKDNIVKHSKSDMHKKALSISKRPRTMEDLYRSTPIGRALACASEEEMLRVSKLVDVAYVVAKEELPFSKFPALVEVEKRHGVDLGNTYTTEHKCKEFVCLIGETMRNEVLDSLKQAKYFSVLLDGSTDCSVTEKELIYVMYVNAGKPKCRFLCLKDVADASAVGIKNTLEMAFADLGITNYRDRMVCLCVDGAAVNLGVRHGMAALLRQDIPSLVAIHCLNHRLELAVKNALTKTYMDEITTMLTNLYYVYENSPKRLRELKAIGEIMDTTANKPEKAHGTRWLQHKSRALHTLLSGYPVIVAHLEAMVADSRVKPADQARFRNFLKKLTSFKFVLHMLFFEALLNPLAALSCNLQGDAVDLLFASASINALYATLQRLKSYRGDGTELARVLSCTTAADGSFVADNVHFREVKLCNVQESILTAFYTARGTYIDSLLQCLRGRLDEIQQNNAFKGIKILDTQMWPTDPDSLHCYGNDEFLLVLDHFRSLLVKRVSIDAVTSEWEAFKAFWLSNLRALSKDEVWSILLTRLESKYPNLLHLIELSLVFPV